MQAVADNTVAARTNASSSPILVIDDDPTVCSLLAAVLSRIRPVIKASDGLSGLRAALQYRPALIVCDCEMPGLRGFDVVRRVREHPLLANVAVVMTSGYGRADVLQDDLPVDGFLQKPFPMADLLQLAGAIVKR